MPATPIRGWTQGNAAREAIDRTDRSAQSRRIREAAALDGIWCSSERPDSRPLSPAVVRRPMDRTHARDRPEQRRSGAWGSRVLRHRRGKRALGASGPAHESLTVASEGPCRTRARSIGSARGPVHRPIPHSGCGDALGVAAIASVNASACRRALRTRPAGAGRSVHAGSRCGSPRPAPGCGSRRGERTRSTCACSCSRCGS